MACQQTNTAARCDLLLLRSFDPSILAAPPHKKEPQPWMRAEGRESDVCSSSCYTCTWRTSAILTTSATSFALAAIFSGLKRGYLSGRLSAAPPDNASTEVTWPERRERQSGESARGPPPTTSTHTACTRTAVRNVREKTASLCDGVGYAGAEIGRESRQCGMVWWIMSLRSLPAACSVSLTRDNPDAQLAAGRDELGLQVAVQQRPLVLDAGDGADRVELSERARGEF